MELHELNVWKDNLLSVIEQPREEFKSVDYMFISHFVVITVILPFELSWTVTSVECSSVYELLFIYIITRQPQAWNTLNTHGFH